MNEFLPEAEQRFYDSAVHRLRSRGWSQIDAEDEALDRIEKKRDKARASASMDTQAIGGTSDAN